MSAAVSAVVAEHHYQHNMKTFHQYEVETRKADREKEREERHELAEYAAHLPLGISWFARRFQLAQRRAWQNKHLL